MYTSPRWAVIFSPEAEAEMAALSQFQRCRVNMVIDDVLDRGSKDCPKAKFVVENDDGSIQVVVESVAPFFVILHVLTGVSWE